MPTLSTIGAACARAWGFTSGLVKDQYFNLVSLLLPGNGTNGAQNNTFLDSSSNTFTITRNGNATQGTFSPFSQTGWGAYFAGSGARVSTTSGSQFAFGTGDFTVEFWMYPTSSSSNVGIFDTRTANNNGLIIRLGDGASNPNVVSAYVAGTELNTKAITYNSWQHVAIVRSSGNGVIYVNGVGSTSKAASGDCSQTGCLIAALYDVLTFNYIGYLSNFRVVKGRAVYTSDFTPPTSNLGATSGGSSPPTGTQTSLLTLQSNRFVDNGGLATPNTLTITNSVSVTPFSPFAPTAAYSAAAVGGSGYFDGTGDYLTVPDNAAFDLPGDFTIECWLYRTANTANTILYTLGSYASGQNGFTLYIETTNNLRCYGNGGFIFTGTNGLVPLNAWTHIALIRSGTGADNMKCYINGVFDTAAKASNNTSWTGVAANGFSPGSFYDGTYGSQTDKTYMAGLRFIKGQALASGDFTPPSAPLTTSTVGWTGANAAGSLTGTVSLLLNFTNAGVVDATAKNVLETVGNAQISTTQSKWGGGSIYLPQVSTTDYLKEPSTIIFSGDFVIEGWIYFSSSSTGFPSLFSGTTSSQLQLQFNSTGATYYFSFGGSTIINAQASGLSTDTWTHFAIVRSGTATNNISVYFGGTRKNQATSTATVTQALLIGVDGSAANPFKGYVDDLRITLGNTRGYSGASITVPSAPFALQ